MSNCCSHRGAAIIRYHSGAYADLMSSPGGTAPPATRFTGSLPAGPAGAFPNRGLINFILVPLSLSPSLTFYYIDQSSATFSKRLSLGRYHPRAWSLSQCYFFYTHLFSASPGSNRGTLPTDASQLGLHHCRTHILEVSAVHYSSLDTRELPSVVQPAACSPPPPLVGTFSLVGTMVQLFASSLSASGQLSATPHSIFRELLLTGYQSL